MVREVSKQMIGKQNPVRRIHSSERYHPRRNSSRWFRR